MTNITRDAIETFRRWYKQNRGIMVVGRMLASGKDEKEIESLEKIPNRPSVTRQIPPYDMGVVHNIVQDEEGQEKDKVENRQHEPFYRSIEGRRRH